MKQKYYVLFRSHSERLWTTINGKMCIPAEDWTEAREGIITNVQFIGTQKNNGILYHTIKADFVETVLLDITPELSDQIYYVTCFGDDTLYKLRSKKRNSRSDTFICQLTNGEIIKIDDYPDSFLFHMSNEHLKYEIEADLLTAHKLKHGAINTEEKAYLAIMKAFTPANLDCCRDVTIIDDGLIYIFYPGGYRDSCQYGIIMNHKFRSTGYGDIAHANSENKRVITLEQIKTYMKNNYISAGADSRHAIPGISRTARKIFTTMKTSDGKLIVQFKATCFKPKYASNPKYLEVITKEVVQTTPKPEIRKWLYREGEYNPYIGWID